MQIVRRLVSVLVAGTLLTSCDGSATTPSTMPTGPASGDVTTYRGDASRTGVMQGQARGDHGVGEPAGRGRAGRRR